MKRLMIAKEMVVKFIKEILDDERKVQKYLDNYEFSQAKQLCDGLIERVTSLTNHYQFTALDILRRRILSNLLPKVKERVKFNILQSCQKLDNYSYEKSLKAYMEILIETGK
jgi:Vacuolar-sorting protein 54, of GARP complex